MDAPLPAPEMLIRPWRTATLLLIAAVLLLAKPLSHAMQRHAEAAAFATPKKTVKTTVPHVKQVVARPKLSRGETKVWVLNGNGRSGAAAGEAGRLQSAGYLVRVWPERHHYFGGVSVVTPTGAAGDPRRSGAAAVLPAR